MNIGSVKLLIISALSIVTFASTSHADCRHNILGTTYGWTDCNLEVVHTSWNNEVRLVVDHSDNHYRIELDGGITTENVDSIKNYLMDAGTYMSDAYNLAISVYLNSTGGKSSEAFRLAELFKGYKSTNPEYKWDVSARVTGKQDCASSCAIAFMAAKYRSITHTGTVSFHAPYTESEYGVRKCKTDPLYATNIEIKNIFNIRLSTEDANRLFTETNVCAIRDLIEYTKDDKWIQSK